MKYIVCHDAKLGHGKYVKAGDIYTASENNECFIIHRPDHKTNIVTSRECALKFGQIKHE